MNIAYFAPVGYKWPWQNDYNYNKMSASVWIRCLQLLPYFKEKKINLLLNKTDSDTKIAVFLRSFGKKHQRLAGLLKDRGTKILLDTPVNYFSEQDLPAFAGDVRKDFNAMLNLSDGVICPSDYIREFGAQKGINTFCIEDSIDLKHFKYKKDKSVKEKLTLVWCGISVKANTLNFLAESIIKNEWDFLVISEKRPALDFPFKFLKWDYNTFPKDILNGDIGIFPRKLDNEYEMGHSSFKILPFLNAEIPLVCTEQPSYKSVLDSDNSIVVDGLEPENWEEAVKKAMGRIGEFKFNTLKTNPLSTENIIHKYLELFNKI